MNVHIADDHDLILKGFEILFKSEDITITGCSRNGKELIKWCKYNEADVYIVDIAMPILNGLEVLRYFKENNMPKKVLIFSGFSDDFFIDTAIKNDAKGFVLKEDSKNLITAIKTIFNGGEFFSESIATVVAEAKFNTKQKAAEQLSEREWEALRLYLQGLDYKGIQKELDIEISTVRSYFKRIRDKLGLKNNTELEDFTIKYLKHDA